MSVRPWCKVDYENEHGFSYDCWEGHSMLPRLNLGEPAVREHIFDVARFWLKEVGVDGWRLDVAHEISPDFWREFRTARWSFINSTPPIF
jgi:glycosidase